MRILIFNWKDLKHPAAGGAEVFTHEVAKRWVGWGHEVTLFCASVDGEPERDEQDGVMIVRRGGRFGVYREARKFYEREGSGKFDLVIDEVNTRPFLTPRFVRDTPVVALIHQVCREIWWYEFPFPVSVLGRFVLEPRWLRLYRDVPTMTVSASSRKSLENYGLRDVTIVPEGLTLPDGPLPTPPKEPVPTMIFVGRLARNKRPHHAIKAFRMIRKQAPQTRLWIVGSGPMARRLRRSAPEGVTFFGKVSQQRKFELMGRSHVLVVPSVREGWGLIVSEAAAVGTPSVAYDVSGLCDAVAQTGRGRLTQPNPAALAAGIEGLLSTTADTPANEHVPAGWSDTAEALMERISKEAVQSDTSASAFPWPT